MNDDTERDARIAYAREHVAAERQIEPPATFEAWERLSAHPGRSPRDLPGYRGAR